MNIETPKVLHVYSIDLMLRDAIKGEMVDYIVIHPPLTWDRFKKSLLYSALLPYITDESKILYHQ